MSNQANVYALPAEHLPPGAGQGGSFRDNRPPGPPAKAFVLHGYSIGIHFNHLFPLSYVPFFLKNIGRK